MAVRGAIKRRTFRKLRAAAGADDHHHVYVVLLDEAVRAQRGVRAANPHADRLKPCVYVGLTGLEPEQRLANHKAGLKSAAVVRRFGIQLLPELFAHLNPMPYAAAAAMEVDLAEDLRQAGYTVLGGH
jgi:D-serine deaminase-like pyridoxal phosphate-dependent protein